MSGTSPDLPVSSSGAGTGSDDAQGGLPPGAFPARPKALSGAEWRKAVKAAQSRVARRQRINRGKYVPKDANAAERGPAGPGMVRRAPPPQPPGGGA